MVDPSSTQRGVASFGKIIVSEINHSRFAKNSVEIEFLKLMGVNEEYLRTTRFYMMRREVQRAQSRAKSMSVSGKKSKYKSKMRRYTNTKKEIEKRMKVQPRSGKTTRFSRFPS